MNCISTKWKSQTGASILMAMVLFLICGFVAAVTLGAAATNAQKYTNQRQQQQSYLSVSSAAQMLRDVLSEKKFIGSENKWIYFCSEAYPGISGVNNYEEDRVEVCKELKTETENDIIQQFIAEGLYEVYRSKNRYEDSIPFSGWTKVMKIRGGVPELYAVNATVTIKRDYGITIVLETAEMGINNDEYAMTLTFTADVKEDEGKTYFTCENVHEGTEMVKQENGEEKPEEVSFQYDKNEHYENITTITLNTGDIRKGV